MDTADLTSALAALANGIIPADERDGGAAVVQAGSRLAEKMAAGVNAALYQRGLESAVDLARTKFGVSIDTLDANQVQEVLAVVRDNQAGFYRQLRMDVCALYLSDAGVWERIGFPGPSAEQGGYPDFDQPQD